MHAFIYKRQPLGIVSSRPPECPRIVHNVMTRLLQPLPDRTDVRELRKMLGTPGPPPEIKVDDHVLLDPNRDNAVEWFFVNSRCVTAAPLAVSIYDRYGRAAGTQICDMYACAELAFMVLYPDVKVDDIKPHVQVAMLRVANSLGFMLYVDTVEWLVRCRFGVVCTDMGMVKEAIKKGRGSTLKAMDHLLGDWVASAFVSP